MSNQKYYNPDSNKVFDIRYDSASTEYCFGDTNNGNTLEGVPIVETLGNIPTADFTDNYLRQFFEISKNVYVIANYGTGRLLSIYNSGAASYLGMGNLDENTATFSFPAPDGSEPGPNTPFAVNCDYASGFVIPDNEAEYFAALTGVSSLADACVMWIEEGKSIQTPPPDEADDVVQLTFPTFTNNEAPPLHPATAELMGCYYIPYFVVNDPMLPDPAQQIKQSPYYILRQYGQYKLSANINNPSANTLTFVEEWQYGWSDSTSSSFSDTIGANIGGSVEGNEIFVKETLSAKINVDMNITLTQTEDQSESQMKQVRINVPTNSLTALYGISTKLSVYQSNGFTLIAQPQAPLCLENGLTVISSDIDTDAPA